MAASILKVSPNNRFLMYEDGKPFFYLADTAWELFHRLTREEAELYLKNRAAKRFTAIQAVALAEFNGLRSANAYGEVPLVDNDPLKPNEKYFEHVDWIVNCAENLGLIVGLLPTWGDKWNKHWGDGPLVFSPQNAEKYGEWIAGRYKTKPIIWILGGDRPVEDDTHRATISAMARGIRRGDNGTHLITFHPRGGMSSSADFHTADWLAFNTLQSGHSGRGIRNDLMIAHDYGLTPVKPCIDSEPRYEDHPIMGLDWNYVSASGYFNDHDVRKAAYDALFAGACGHTYGCHPIWQFADESHGFVNNARTPWRKAMDLPGAGHMQHARDLLESRPYFSRIPDQSIIKWFTNGQTDECRATRDVGGSYAMVYVPRQGTVQVSADCVKGKDVKASWFNPRVGTYHPVEVKAVNGMFSVATPIDGQDWVLVIETAG